MQVSFIQLQTIRQQISFSVELFCTMTIFDPIVSQSPLDSLEKLNPFTIKISYTNSAQFSIINVIAQNKKLESQCMSRG